MGLQRIGVQEALAQLDRFHSVIDARSESEYAEDRLPSAVNWPSLKDEERRLVGTQYKQVSAFEARKMGAVLVARNIARHIEREVLTLPKNWKPLVYCWRGGQRSGAMALILSQIGFDVTVLEGGYKAFRQHIVQWLPEAGIHLPLVVLCGRTGSAKTRLLRTLAARGAQVLDLEALAVHRGSILGAEPDRDQPSQKAFEHALWLAIQQLDPQRPVFIESESRTIGRLRLPESLILRMRAAPCIHVDMPIESRVKFLCTDYAHFVADREALAKRLDALRVHQGHATVNAWQEALHQGRTPDVVHALLTQHYDPVYLRSMRSHFSQFDQADRLCLPDGEPQTLELWAQHLMGMADGVTSVEHGINLTSSVELGKS
jgi:tRNA 2-selenouridine synthase